MTLVSQIITDAYRESNLIRVGSTPTTDQQSEALRRLQNVVSSCLGGEAGENFTDWPLGTYGRQNTSSIDGYVLARPQINSRLLALATEAKTVYLPVSPSDGSRIALLDPYSRLSAFPVTLDGNGRTIEGEASLVFNTNAINRTWFYRADLSNWVRVTDIASDQDLPFPTEFDDYFVTMLAMRVNPRYGKKMADTTVSRLKQQLQQFQNRYLQSAPLEITRDLARSSRQSFNNFGDYPGYGTDYYNRGWPW